MQILYASRIAGQIPAGGPYSAVCAVAISYLKSSLAGRIFDPCADPQQPDGEPPPLIAV